MPRTAAATPITDLATEDMVWRSAPMPTHAIRVADLEIEDLIYLSPLNPTHVYRVVDLGPTNYDSGKRMVRAVNVTRPYSHGGAIRDVKVRHLEYAKMIPVPAPTN